MPDGHRIHIYRPEDDPRIEAIAQDVMHSHGDDSYVAICRLVAENERLRQEVESLRRRDIHII
jgi:hypothetical protein